MVKWWRISKFDSPVKIGVLDEYLEEHKTGKQPSKSFTQYNPRDWYDELESIERFGVTWIVATEISNNLDIIVKPFGETYPEIDKPNLTTLRGIRTFMENKKEFCENKTALECVSPQNEKDLCIWV